jgi:hypothetical protein
MSEHGRRDDPYAGFPIRSGGARPAVGKSTLAEPVNPNATGVPGKQTLAQHVQPASVFQRPPDEVPEDWNFYVRPAPPPDPFAIHNVFPLAWCPLPPASTWEHQPNHHDLQAAHTPDENQHVLLNQAVLDRRDIAWASYRVAASQVMSVQTSVADEINRFRQTTPEDAVKMGLLVPKGFRGGFAELADQQEVPHGADTRVGQLFDANQHARSPGSNRHGLAHIKASAVGLSRSDTQLEAALIRVKAALDTVSSTRENLEAASEALNKGSAELRVELAESEVQELSQSHEDAKKAVEFITDGPKKLTALLKTVTDPSAACSLIFNLLPSVKLEEAKARLNTERANVRSAKIKVLQGQLAAAKSAAAAAVEELVARKLDLQAAQLGRRDSYGEVGAKTEDQNLGASLAAIPIVETVVARAKNISDATLNVRPPCSENAALGYGIALQHRQEEAMLLPIVIGELEGAHAQFGSIWSDWNLRLKSLMTLKEEILGVESFRADLKP